MKRTLLSFVFALTAIVIMAAPVSQETTLRLASFFFHEHGGTSSLTLSEAPQYPHLHIYSASDGKGFVIMSADDVVLPVLAYSTNNPISLTNMPDNVEYWLGDYENQIRWHAEGKHIQSGEVAEAWQSLSNLTPTKLKTMSQNALQTGTANLLTTTWSQYPHYNVQCPYDSNRGKYTMTGCVATAMAQIMKYWGHPLRGMGSYSYNDPPYGMQSADFSDTIFDYASMPAKVNSYSSQAGKDAVALLMRRCGIAVEMEYGVDGSSAATIGDDTIGFKSAENAYREYFKYMHTLHSVSLSDYTDNEWVALLKDEIDNGRPAHYSAGDEYEGGGHSFICCGYDNTGKLYFNWGWNGNNDGYFTIGQLNPGSSHYNARNKAIIGIIPDTTEAATTTITLSADIPGAATLTGAGTYNSYTDQATIKAIANPGYLVDGWNDNLTYNPYNFLANGGNVSYTARCTKITGDTVGYCTDEYYTRYGSSVSKIQKWAIRLDSASIAGNRMLRKVSAYFSETGNHIISVYYGSSTEPSSQCLSSDTINISSEGNWRTITLKKPVPVDHAQSLWIVLSWTGKGYPKSCSQFRGNIDALWSYDNSTMTWENYYDYNVFKSWMIRAIFEYNPGPYKVNVVANNSDLGSTTGSGTYAAGTNITITATPYNGYNFLYWNDGVTAPTRNVTVTDATTYTAIFENPHAGVDNIDLDNTIAYSTGHKIVIENAEGKTANIYDAAGRLVMTRNISSTFETIALPTGVYFVNINSKTTQVVVNQ